MNYRNHEKLGNVEPRSTAYDFDRTGDYDIGDHYDDDTGDTDDIDEIEDSYDIDDIEDVDEVEDEESDELEEFEDDEDDDYANDGGCDCDTSDRSSPRKPMISLPPDLVIRLLLLALAAVTGTQTVAWLHPAVEQMCDELDDLFHLFR